MTCMTKRPFTFIYLAFLVISLYSCSGDSHDHTEIDLGTMKGNVYQNKFFEFKLKLPDNWKKISSKQRHLIAKKEVKLLAGKNFEMEKNLDHAHNTKSYLFSWFQKLSGTGFSASMLGVAERLTGSQGINSAKEYLSSVSALMHHSAVRYKRIGEIKLVKLNTQYFSVLSVEATVAGQNIKQRYYTRIHRDYALTLIISWENDSQLTIMNQSLSNIGRYNLSIAH